MALYKRMIWQSAAAAAASRRRSVAGLLSCHTDGEVSANGRFGEEAVEGSKRHFNTGEASSSSGNTALAARGPYACRLKSRGVLSFHGPDTFGFLQGLLTNDVMRLAQDPTPEITPQPTPNLPFTFVPPLYSALLNPQGRFLFDMFLYRPSRPSEKLDRWGGAPGTDNSHLPSLLADVDSVTIDELLMHLKKHQLRAKLNIEKASEYLSVWQRFGGSFVDKNGVEKQPGKGSIGWGGTVDPAGCIASEGNGQGWHWYKDPRLEVLGLRGLFPSDTVPPLVEADKEVNEEYYLLWRIEQGVAEGSTEICKGEAIPLEYNLAGLNAISFDKGCYVGQELVARTHHRGVIRKRVMPVNFVNEDGGEVQQAVSQGAELLHVDSGRKVGNVTTVLGPRGLALIRLEAVHRDTSQFVVKDLERVYARAIRPKWWSAEWGQEEEQTVSGGTFG